MNDGLVYRLM